MPSAQPGALRFFTGVASIRCLAAFACRHVQWAIGWRAGVLGAWLACHPARYLRSGWSPGVYVRRWQGCVFPLSGAPWFICGVHRGLLALWPGGWCGWRGCVVFYWRCQTGFGHLARVPAWAGLPCGLPVLACCHSSPPSRAMPPVSRPRDAGPPSGACGLACLPAGCRPGRWRAPAPGPGPGWAPGDCQMVLLWAVLPVRLLGRGVDGVPVWPVPGHADGTLGSTCRVPLEPGDLGSRLGCGHGDAWCRGVARAGRWWRRSG